MKVSKNVILTDDTFAGKAPFVGNMKSSKSYRPSEVLPTFCGITGVYPVEETPIKLIFTEVLQNDDIAGPLP